MVKECLVTLNNEAVTVVKFDGKDIQFPSVHKDVKKVFVEYLDGKYFIVDEKRKNEYSDRVKKKSVIKKPIIEEQVTPTEVVETV